jgi:TnpA family transposase
VTATAPALLASRRSGIRLPEDPSDEELARNWTLSNSDKKEVRLCRGEENRRRFALQLCVLRGYGRFLEAEEAAPVRIVNHLGAQLELPPVLFAGGVRRAATESEYAERIRRYLGYVRFHRDLQHELAAWVAGRTLEGLPAEEVTQQAERWLRERCVVLPRAAVFARLIAGQCRRAEQGLYASLAQQAPANLRMQLDMLLEVPEGSNRSQLFHLKEYPPEGRPETILAFLDNYFWLKEAGLAGVRLRGCHPALVRQFAWAVRRNDAWHLRAYPEQKRHALLLCFVIDALKTVLDHAVEMDDQYLTGMCRRSLHAFERELIDARKQARRGNERVLSAMEMLLSGELPESEALDRLFEQIPKADLKQAVSDCRALGRVELFGYAEALESRLSHLNRYQPRFFELPFEAQRGAEPILNAVDVVRRLHRGELDSLPADAPTAFVDPDLRTAIKRGEQALRWHTWQIAVGLGVRDHLRSGDLYLSESRKHGQFWNLVYEQAQWEQERQQGYALLSLPTSADAALQHLGLQLDRVAAEAEQGLPANSFAAVRHGRLKLTQPDRLEVLESAEQLRRVFKSLLGRVRIEHLLREVDSWCRFTEAFRCSGRTPPLRAVLLATLIAHGTNLGISVMGCSAEGITVDMLRHASQWFLNEETLKAANKTLVDYHYHLPLARLWGSGRRSSSDGQRFLLRQSSLLGAFYPRYFGYYDQALSVYTHLSDQLSVFSNQVISCRKHESLYVLSGLLLNDTILQPQFHHTDTGGVTDHIFALCHLLGIEFMPRIKDLPDQSLFKLDRHRHYGELDCLFDETVSRELLTEQWDQMVRLTVSLKNRLAPPEVVVERLASAAPADRLAKALTAYGRIIKTIYILRYIQDEKLRRAVQMQLNRGEARHSLARWLFFANRGEFRDGDLNEIMNKTSCLSLLCNAAVLWNTVRMQKIVEQLRNSGQIVQDEDLARVWPLLHEHILPNGIYDFAGC